MEWSSPAIVLNLHSYGETSAIVSVLSLDYGLFRGMVRGALSRQQIALWQMGNFLTAHWSARLPEQLGSLKGELVHATAAYLLESPLLLSILRSACAVVEGGVLERQAVPALFQQLFQLLTSLTSDLQLAEQIGVPALINWEIHLLKELGYGLDFSLCDQLGKSQSYWVSPKTGRIVSEEMAADWKDRLFCLPSFCLDSEEKGTLEEWCEGLRMTGHFLARYVFGNRNISLPAARILLYDQLQKRLACQNKI